MLDRRKILITNGHDGLGLAMAQAAAAAGAEVAIQATRARDLAAAEDSFGACLATCLADLDDPTTPDRLIEDAAQSLGGLDGLIHLQSARGPSVPFSDFTAEDLDQMLALHVRTPLLLARAAASHMAARAEGGSVVIVNPQPSAPEHFLARAAQDALSAFVRHLSDQPFRINQLDIEEEPARHTQLEIARHAIFWLSDMSAPATNQIYAIAADAA